MTFNVTTIMTTNNNIFNYKKYINNITQNTLKIAHNTQN